MSKPIVVVEVACRAPRQDWLELSCLLTTLVQNSYKTHGEPSPGAMITLQDAPCLIADVVLSLRLSDLTLPTEMIAWRRGEVAVQPVLYQLHDSGSEETLWADAAGGGPSCSVLSLPHISLEGRWETLHYGETSAVSAAFKRDLLQYAYTALHFARAGVSDNYILWNRLLLLHGPPGTGKTSLCASLAHKLAIRLGDVFAATKLIEINAHSLFSRWFSESGKQVMQLFASVRQIAADSSCLVVVVMDEVESLVAARQSALQGHEPSDAMRVVNALLTQLDALQRRTNVLLLATSNFTDAIDDAFLDRTDKKIFVGPPGVAARQAMLTGGVEELLRCGLLFFELSPPTEAACSASGEKTALHATIRSIAALCEGMNGRTLKKLPFLAYSACLTARPESSQQASLLCCAAAHEETSTGAAAYVGGATSANQSCLPLRYFLDALRETAQKHNQVRGGGAAK